MGYQISNSKETMDLVKIHSLHLDVCSSIYRRHVDEIEWRVFSQSQLQRDLINSNELGLPQGDVDKIVDNSNTLTEILINQVDNYL